MFTLGKNEWLTAITIGTYIYSAIGHQRMKGLLRRDEHTIKHHYL